MFFSKKNRFVAIAETGNITKAAQLLHMSQPSLSQYITRLEKGLGVKLIDRSVSPIELTEAGKLYLAYLQNAHELERCFLNELEQYKEKRDSILTIGIPAQLTPDIFDGIVLGFMQAHPQSQLTVKEGTSLSVMRQLIDNEVDIAFFHTRSLDDARFKTRLMRVGHLYLVCNAQSAFLKGRRAQRSSPLLLTKEDIQAIEDIRFLTTPKEYYLYQVMAEYLCAADVKPRHSLEISHLHVILGYILKPGSDGISLIPDFTLSEFAHREPELAFLSLDGAPVTWYLTMNLPRSAKPCGIARAFWEHTAPLELHI